MLFTKKSKKQDEVRLLEKQNIKLNCKRQDKEAVIRQVGEMLYRSGYVDKEYTEAMVLRESTFSTNIGNGIALPHGVEEAKKNVKNSGIAVMVFPDGTSWGEEDVKLVIGIAGVGDAHLDILANIATKLAEPGDVEKLIYCTADEIYKTLTGGEPK